MMSGTSVDGVDAIVVDFDPTGRFSTIASQFTPYPSDLRKAINSLAQNKGTLDASIVEKLDIILAHFYSDAALRLLADHQINHESVTAIANHGQTIRHEPNANPPRSLQIGDPATIASRSNIRTIAQFRQADMTAGGQGAPLMPAFHSHYFRNDRNRIILNIGGIANITVLNAAAESSTFGFDTGPGNTLLDQWIFEHQGVRYDANGNWASSHSHDPRLLSTFLADPYFHLPHPKSTGPDYFNLEWLNRIFPKLTQLDPGVVQATLLELTAESIRQSVLECAPASQEIFVCGGGAHNTHLMNRMIDIFSDSGIRLAVTEELGVPADWVEALGFAWLGYCFDEKIPSNLPSVTGAQKKVVLGESFPAAECLSESAKI